VVVKSVNMPVNDVPKMVTGTSLVLVTDTDCAVLVVPITCGLNAKPAELKVSAGAPTTPLPDKFTNVVARPLVLLDANSCPVNAPFCVGRNAMFTMQLAFWASVAGQLFDCEKFAPIENAGLLNVRLVVPVLLTVTICAALAVPTAWSAKIKFAGASVVKG
jgi:hypothetical protein